MKKLLACTLAGLLAIQGLQSIAFAADAGLIEVISASVGAGETFELPVTIEKNPGVAAISLNLSYDAGKLELLGAEDGKILGTSTFTPCNDLTMNPFTMNWDDLSKENNTGTGALTVLKFRAKDNAAGDTKVSVSVNQKSTFNIDLEDVVFDTMSGTVSIAPGADAPVIQADSVTAEAGSTAEVPIRIINNPGITALSLSISYDSEKLKLLGAEDGKLLGTSTFTPGNDLTLIPYTLNWDDLAKDDNTGSGIVATLKFEVSEGAEGASDVTVAVNQKSTFNVALKEVAFAAVSGKVTVGSAVVTEPAQTTVKRTETTFTTAAKTAGTTTAPKAADTTTAPKAADTTTAPKAAVTTTAPKAADTTTAPKAAVTTTVPKAADTTTAPKAAVTTTAPKAAVTTTAPKAAVTTTAPKAAGTTTVPQTVGTTTAPQAAVTTAAPVVTTTAPAQETTPPMPEGPAIIADTVSANAGEQVEVPIRIQKNPGITALSLNITYDNEKLKLIGAEDGKLLGTSTFTPGNDLTLIPYTINWDDLSTENNTGNGVVATLKFEVLEGAEGTAAVDVAVNQRSTYNVDLVEVAFAAAGGRIKIGGEPAAPADDLNGDGAVTVADAVLLARFVSEDPSLTEEQVAGVVNADPDYDGDGMITLLDIRCYLKKLEAEP